MEFFLKAWEGKFEGFDLSWRELEICRTAIVPASVGELRDKLRAQYKIFDTIHQSNFYRIVGDLVSNGYLTEREEGRSKIIQISPLGLEELGRVNRYILEMQIEGIKEELWIDLMQIIKPHIGCILDDNLTVLAIGPEYKAITSLIRESRICSIHEYHNVEPEALQNKITFLNYGADMTGKSAEARSIDVKLDDWPFKDNYADIIIEFTVLNTFRDNSTGEKVFKEALRVLKPGGKLAMFELTRETSRLAQVLLQEFTQMLRNSIPPDIKWDIPQDFIERSEIEKLLNKFAKEIKIDAFVPDIINTKVILEKLESSQE